MIPAVNETNTVSEHRAQCAELIYSRAHLEELQQS